MGDTREHMRQFHSNSPLDGETSWGEREVRHLLSLLRRPDLAAGNPLGNLLCDLLNVDTPLEAVERLVAGTFAKQGQAGARLAELVRRCDLEGELSQSGVAKEMGLSIRQFFRYRSRAVELLAGEVRRLLGDAGPASSPSKLLVDMLCKVDPGGAIEISNIHVGSLSDRQRIDLASAYVEAGQAIPDSLESECGEIVRPVIRALRAQIDMLDGNVLAAKEWIAYASPPVEGPHRYEHAWSAIQRARLAVEATYARSSDDPQNLLAVSRQLRDLANNEADAIIESLLYEAEATLRLGRLSETEEIIAHVSRMAQSTRDVRAVAHLTMLRAMIALIDGDPGSADELADTASIALRKQWPRASPCFVICARAKLLLGERWHAPDALFDRPLGAWDRLSIESMQSRYLLREGRHDEAAALANDVVARAELNGFAGISAHCEATLAACAALRGDEAEERRRYLAAWSIAVRSRDRLLASDLFALPFARPRDLGPMALDDAFHRHLTTHTLDLLASLDVETADLPDLELQSTLAFAIAFANGDGQTVRSNTQITLRLRPIWDHLGCDLAMLLPHQRRARWLERWGAALNHVSSIAFGSRVA